MNIELTDKAAEDISYWNKVDPGKTERIKRLLENISVTPFEGLGKPEPLKHALRGFWSRRIDHEHRLVYRVTGDNIQVISCRFHYS